METVRGTAAVRYRWVGFFIRRGLGSKYVWQTPCVHLLSKDKPIRGVSTICARNALPNPPRTRPWSMLFD